MELSIFMSSPKIVLVVLCRNKERCSVGEKGGFRRCSDLRSYAQNSEHGGVRHFDVSPSQ